jgi:SAM-dependent methyltransferase
MKSRERIVKDQQAFFNENASVDKPVLSSRFFLDYANKEQLEGFRWLSDRLILLDYGCGTGTSIESFMEANPSISVRFIGVDISREAVKIAKTKFDCHEFLCIDDNDVSKVRDMSVDGAYLLHVLHHAHNHSQIFNAIYSKLQDGGKFFISDLSSNNSIISLGRLIFSSSPNFIKSRFLDDLVVDGAIPEKYRVDPELVIEQLHEAGFEIVEVGYGHLFVFLFAWLDRFLPFSRFSAFRILYQVLTDLERTLLKLDFMKRRAEVFYIKCIKPIKSL